MLTSVWRSHTTVGAGTIISGTRPGALQTGSRLDRGIESGATASHAGGDQQRPGWVRLSSRARGVAI